MMTKDYVWICVSLLLDHFWFQLLESFNAFCQTKLRVRKATVHNFFFFFVRVITYLLD